MNRFSLFFIDIRIDVPGLYVHIRREPRGQCDQKVPHNLRSTRQALQPIESVA